MTWAANQRAEDPLAKSVLLRLADQADTNGRCFPSIKTLSDDVEISTRTVQRKLQHLVEKGLIRIESRTRRDGKSHTSNRYHLLADGAYVRPSGDDCDDAEDFDPPVSVTEGGVTQLVRGGGDSRDTPYEPSEGTSMFSDENIGESEEALTEGRTADRAPSDGLDCGYSVALGVYPPAGLANTRPTIARKEHAKAVAELGLDRLIEAIRAFADDAAKRSAKYCVGYQGWLSERRWEVWLPGGPADVQAVQDRMPVFAGPADLRSEVMDWEGREFVASYLDPAGWIGDTRTIVPRTRTAMHRLVTAVGPRLDRAGVTIGEPALARDEPMPGMPEFPGPPDVRDQVVDWKGRDFTASYLDPAGWDEESRTIHPRNSVAHSALVQGVGHRLNRVGVKIGPPRRPT